MRPPAALRLACGLAVASLAAAGCGGSGSNRSDSELVVQQRIANARADAARLARLEDRNRELRQELRRSRERRPASTVVQTTVTESVPPPAAPAGEPRGSGYIAQLGSFTYHDNAVRQAATLRARGVPAQILRSDDYAGLRAGYWVTYAGFFGARGEAVAMVARARTAGVSDAFARPATYDGSR
jgi:cell division protein FtsN